MFQCNREGIRKRRGLAPLILTPWNWMDANGQIYAPAAFPTG